MIYLNTRCKSKKPLSAVAFYIDAVSYLQIRQLTVGPDEIQAQYFTNHF